MLDSTIMLPLMRRAITLALTAKMYNEVPIGAIVYSKTLGIIGEGYNQIIQNNDPTAHAEVVALRTACATLTNYRIPQCYLISTIEPCFFCLGASLNARIHGIVYGAEEPKTGAFTHALIPSHFQTHLHSIQHGILAEECASIIQEFFKAKRI